jgi:hypothetical protein
VSLALAGIAAVVAAGAVLAVSSREPRAVVLGILIVLLGSCLIVTPWPDPPAILARVAAALLAARLLLAGLRGDDLTTTGSRSGWPAEALLAAAAAIAGFASHGLGAAGLGPPEAQAAGFALGALAAAPLLVGRDALRLGVGAVLLLQGALLVRQALDAPPTEGEQLVYAFLTVALGGAVAVIATAARAAGGLEVVDDPAGSRARRRPDAHRLTERELERERAREAAPEAPEAPAERGRGRGRRRRAALEGEGDALATDQ